MAFYYITIDDGCMARLENDWNVIPGLNLRDSDGVFCLDDKAHIFQMFDPAAAAPSARGLINFNYCPLAMILCNYLPSKKHD